MSSHNGRSGRPPSRCSSAWALPRSSPIVFARFRPVVPILATLLLSLVYSMILFVAFNALAAPIPVADPVALVLPCVVYDTILAALIGPLAISIHDRRAEVGTGGLVSAFLDERPKPVRSLSRFLTFALIAVIGVDRPDGAAVLPPDASTAAGSPRSPRAIAPSSRRSRPRAASSTTATAALLVTNVADLRREAPPADLPLDQRPAVVDRLAALLADDGRRHQRARSMATQARPSISSGSPSDVDEQTARLISEAGIDLPGVEVVVEARRQYTDGPLMSQILGYTGPVSGEQLAELKSRRLPARRSHRQGRRRSAVRDRAARHVRHARASSATRSGRRTQVLQTVTRRRSRAIRSP